METLPLKPNPQMAFLPVNLGWLPNKAVLGGVWCWPVAPGSCSAPGKPACGGSWWFPGPLQVSRRRFGAFSFFKE